jgi:CheY-like chemotaxis protein/anti-sigma regulatory factor (Ser/Thr protein kinase)
MTGKILLAREPVDLADTVRHVVATLQATDFLTERHVEVDIAPVWVDGDRTRLDQILTNLLVNAGRYTSPGQRIRVRVAREGDAAVVRVTDDGQGIAREDLPRVFELFFQAEAGPDRPTGGLGVGLTLVQRLVELHDGEVSAESDGPGKGATFAVRLPAIAAPKDVQSGHDEPAREGHDETVLVVEDNADARESLSVLLELQGYRVLQATDGTAALDILRSARPRVAVLDIGLPGMDGYEVARRARAEHGQEIVLIALTGYVTARDEERGTQAGFDRHLAKPVSIDALLRAIAQKNSGRRPGHLMA